MPATPTRRYPLYVHISTLFLTLLALVGGLLAWLAYSRTAQLVETSVADVFTRITRESGSELERIVSPASTALDIVATHRIAGAATLRERLESLGFFARALEAAPPVTSLYVGYASGDFFLVRRVHGEEDRLSLRAPRDAAYMVQSVEHVNGAPEGAFIYFDADLMELGRDLRPEYTRYDPRTRSWYNAARQGTGTIRTAPYVFFTTRKAGITLARKTIDPRAIAGADIRLETLADVLRLQKLTPGSELALFDAGGQVIAYEDPSRVIRSGGNGTPVRLARLDELGVPPFKQLAAHLRAKPDLVATPRQTTVGDASWHTLAVQIPGTQAQPVFLAFAVPDNELLAHARALRDRLLTLTALIVLLAIPVTLLLARVVSSPLRRLVHEVEAIRQFDFASPVGVRSMVLEVDRLSRTMDDMKHTIRRFLEISSAVAAENRFERLLPLLLDEMIATSRCDAGVLLLANAGGDALEPAAVHVGGAGRLVSGPALPVPAWPAVLQASLADAPGSSRTDALDARELLAWGDALADVAAAVDGRSAIAVPLFNRARKLVGAIILLGAEASDAAKLRFIGALSGTASVSLESRELIRAQKALFEAFIQLIASAIDAKSPYTGGHCARVPELTKMLARAACDATAGPFRDFSLSEEAWEAVHIAAWLHDCGKVTTPEYIVDKATKLETLYDRIHEVRMRFEVLKRDAQILMWQRIAEGSDPVAAREACAASCATLDEEFAFVAACNEGGEYMAPDKLARLQQIAARTWTRTLDDRLGISHEELARKREHPSPPLPASEALLADKPEHRIPRPAAERYPEDNPWGFRMDTPELLFNRGELTNLSVGRGTLTAEDRYAINAHIVQTIVMLSQLPFPKHLQNVPELAGGHHEKMDGTGYPKRLSREDMSPVARMMAIADIFEALTAADRPYKRGKSLSESIRIMAAMKRDGHIDPQLFDLFLRSGVYLDYAQRFMRPEAIDAVPIDEYLEPTV